MKTKSIFFMLAGILLASMPGYGQENDPYAAHISSDPGANAIVQYEYWFDDGFGDRVIAPVAPVELLDLQIEISTDGLSEGLHLLHMRFKDQGLLPGAELYSPVKSHLFYKGPVFSSEGNKVVAYEYWFDEDRESKVFQNVTPTNEYILLTDIDAAQLATGLHLLHIRFQDNVADWSAIKSQLFYKMPIIPGGINNIVGYRYWFDDDLNNVFLINLPQPVSPFDLLTDVDAAHLSEGLHIFHIQFQDAGGLWSSIVSTEFSIPDIDADDDGVPDVDDLCPGVDDNSPDCIGSCLDSIAVTHANPAWDTIHAARLVSTSGSITIALNDKAVYRAGEEIMLQPGFHAQGIFSAQIAACVSTAGNTALFPENATTDSGRQSIGTPEKDRLLIYPIPDSRRFIVEVFTAKIEAKSRLDVLNLQGQLIQRISLPSIEGFYRTLVDLDAYPTGVYIITYRNNKVVITKNLVID